MTKMLNRTLPLSRPIPFLANGLRLFSFRHLRARNLSLPFSTSYPPRVGWVPPGPTNPLAKPAGRAKPARPALHPPMRPPQKAAATKANTFAPNLLPFSIFHLLSSPFSALATRHSSLATGSPVPLRSQAQGARITMSLAAGNIPPLGGV